MDNLHKFICEELQLYMIPANMSCSYFNIDENTVTGLRTEINQYLNDVVYRFVKNEKAHTVISISGKGKQLTSTDYPVDKYNYDIWKLPRKKKDDKKENIKDNKKIIIHVEKQTEKNDPIKVIVKLSFDEITEELLSNHNIIKQLEPYDKKVYVAIANCYYKLGLRRMTIGQIYHAMGNEQHITKLDYDKICNSIIKMSRTWIRFDNEAECERYEKYNHFSVNEHLLQCSIYTQSEKEKEPENNSEIDLYVNGKLIDFYIYVNAEPILYRFAKDRNQIFPLEQELLNVPTIHNTNENVTLIDYLIHRMRMATEYKKRKGQKKILKSTLFETVGADSWKKRYNAEYRTRVILNYWAEKGFGKGFKEEDDCFILKV